MQPPTSATRAIDERLASTGHRQCGPLFGALAIESKLEFHGIETGALAVQLLSQ